MKTVLGENSSSRLGKIVGDIKKGRESTDGYTKVKKIASLLG